MMTTIGRDAAVARVGGLAFTRFPAWLGVHLVNLIGFRNRLFVLTNSAWDYFLFERMVHLILPAASFREPFDIQRVINPKDTLMDKLSGMLDLGAFLQ